MTSEVQTISASSPAELDQLVNAAIFGRMVKNVSYSQNLAGQYSATILFETKNDRNLLVEG